MECLIFLDDIVVHASTVEKHDKILSLVLSRLAEHGVVLNYEKTLLGVEKLEFDGHTISADGIQPIFSNVDGIVKAPLPQNASQLKSFLGAVGYYAKFIPGYSNIIEPLRHVTGPKGDVWNWTQACDNAVYTLKQCLTTPPVLAYFNPAAKTVLTTDASATAIGACLSQIVNGVERPVAFISRVLSPTEQRYSVVEREALACVWATERLHFFLYGRHFELRTDHRALTTLLGASGWGRRPLRLYRWCDRLLQYSFDVVYHPGDKNRVADYLSRIAVQDSDSDCSDDVTIATIFGTSSVAVIDPLTLAVHSNTDEDMKILRQYIVDGWPRQFDQQLQPYYAVRDELSVLPDGCIVRGNRAVIPSNLRRQVLSLAHEGHPGIVRMKSKCRESVWWPGIDREVEHFVRDCVACTISGKSVKPTIPPLRSIEAHGPW